MANKGHISLSQDELFGAIKASQFMLAELASYIKAEPYLKDRILIMQKALREHGLVSGEGRGPEGSSHRRRVPSLFSGNARGSRSCSKYNWAPNP